MPSGQSHTKPRVSRGFRTGIILGLVIAALGIAVGTVTGATTITPFQQVVVVNGPASPVPVTGTVNIGNTPANQTVTVSNFPATQAVSGSVSVSNLPAADLATTAFDDILNIDAGDTEEIVVPGHGINLTYIRVTDDALGSESVTISFKLASGIIAPIYTGDTPFTNNFSVPVPITKVLVRCENAFTQCFIDVAALGN